MVRKHLALWVVVLSGCASMQARTDANRAAYAAETARLDAVRVTSNPAAVQGCKPMGAIAGEHKLSAVEVYFSKTGLDAEKDAERDLRKNATGVGANTVLTSGTSTTKDGSRIRGEAYWCRPANP